VRVRVPDKAVPTYFAGVIGVDAVDVTADAVAEAKLKRDDRIIPATVAASSGVSCAQRTSGNFGSFDARRVTLFKPTSNVEQNSLRINYSMGIDHALAIYGSGTTKVCDVLLKSPCTTTNVSSNLEANHLVPYTGNAVPPLTDGVIENATIPTDDGTLLFCGRLKRPDLTDENLASTDPEGCTHWTDAPGPGPAITVLGEKINGRHVYYWMKPAFRSLFFPGASESTPSTSATWATGDAKLECFLRSYRFDYGGSYSQGHAPQTEFFIDPSTPIDPSTGVGTEFTLDEAKAYLTTTCGLDAATVNAKLASLTDAATFWPMFDHGMVTDPRFGMIPVVKNFGSGGSTAMRPLLGDLHVPALSERREHEAGCARRLGVRARADRDAVGDRRPAVRLPDDATDRPPGPLTSPTRPRRRPTCRSAPGGRHHGSAGGGGTGATGAVHRTLALAVHRTLPVAARRRR
jgi:hypothetical protein